MMDKPTYGNMLWVDDDTGMKSLHVIDDETFEVQGYESSADEYQVFMGDTPIFHYVHTFGGRAINVNGDPIPETLVAAVLALVDRMDVSWNIGNWPPASLTGRKVILTAEDTLFMEGFLEHNDYPELPSEVADAVAPDGTEGGTLRFYAVPAWDVMTAEANLEKSEV
jgi:hypothetical protein